MQVKGGESGVFIIDLPIISWQVSAVTWLCAVALSFACWNTWYIKCTHGRRNTKHAKSIRCPVAPHMCNVSVWMWMRSTPCAKCCVILSWMLLCNFLAEFSPQVWNKSTGLMSEDGSLSATAVFCGFCAWKQSIDVLTLEDDYDFLCEVELALS